MGTRRKRQTVDRVPITIRFDPMTKHALTQAAPRAHESINSFVVQAVQHRCAQFGISVGIGPPPLNPVPPAQYELGRRSERIDLRVSPVERAIISYAAEHHNKTQTKYIVDTALREAGHYGIDEDYVREMKRILPHDD